MNNESTTTRKVALVVGANGVIGRNKPTGESESPYARVCGRVDCIDMYPPSRESHSNALFLY